MTCSRALARAFALGLAAILPAAAWAAPSARVEPVQPCFVAPMKGAKFDAKYDCGYVIVPEDAAKPAGRTVKLGYLRLQARKPAKAAPVFMLAGGPGSSLIEPTTFLLFNAGFLGPLLDTRDVVLLDQRGTRHTVPQLDCPDVRSASSARFSQGLGEDATNALQHRALERCVQAFRSQGIDLAQYNSVALAADVDAVRRALGYERIVYYGGSYGSQLGQHVMRDFPGILDAVILDGANSLSRKSWIEDRALDVDYSIRHIARLCQDGPKCRVAYDIPALIDRGLALFDAGPIPATYTDPKAPGTTLRFDVRRSDFVSLIYEKQGYKIGVGSLPFILQELVKDGRASMAAGMGSLMGQKALQAAAAPTASIATVMHFAVVCSDDPVRSVDELVTAGVRNRYAILFGQQVAREYVRACEALGVPSLPDATDVDVTAPVPTLILSGALDAQTPTFRSEVVAKALPDARLVVFPDGTHVQVGAVNACAFRIMLAFVRDPKGALPLECVADSRFQGFILPDGTVGR